MKEHSMTFQINNNLLKNTSTINNNVISHSSPSYSWSENDNLQYNSLVSYLGQIRRLLTQLYGILSEMRNNLNELDVLDYKILEFNCNTIIHQVQEYACDQQEAIKKHFIMDMLTGGTQLLSGIWQLTSAYKNSTQPTEKYRTDKHDFDVQYKNHNKAKEVLAFDDASKQSPNCEVLKGIHQKFAQKDDNVQAEFRAAENNVTTQDQDIYNEYYSLYKNAGKEIDELSNIYNKSSLNEVNVAITEKKQALFRDKKLIATDHSRQLLPKKPDNVRIDQQLTLETLDSSISNPANHKSWFKAGVMDRQPETNDFTNNEYDIIKYESDLYIKEDGQPKKIDLSDQGGIDLAAKFTGDMDNATLTKILNKNAKYLETKGLQQPLLGAIPLNGGLNTLKSKYGIDNSIFGEKGGKIYLLIPSKVNSQQFLVYYVDGDHLPIFHKRSITVSNEEATHLREVVYGSLSKTEYDRLQTITNIQNRADINQFNYSYSSISIKELGFDHNGGISLNKNNFIVLDNDFDNNGRIIHKTLDKATGNYIDDKYEIPTQHRQAFRENYNVSLEILFDDKAQLLKTASILSKAVEENGLNISVEQLGKLQDTWETAALATREIAVKQKYMDKMKAYYDKNEQSVHDIDEKIERKYRLWNSIGDSFTDSARETYRSLSFMAETEKSAAEMNLQVLNSLRELLDKLSRNSGDHVSNLRNALLDILNTLKDEISEITQFINKIHALIR